MIAEGTESTLTLREIFRVLFRQKKKVLLFFFLTISLVMAFIVAWPRTYESEAKLYIRVGRESVTLDPTATTGQVIDVEISHEHEIRSFMEILKSRMIAERVVSMMGTDTILNRSDGQTKKKNGVPFAWLARLKASIGTLDPISDREKAIIQIRQTTEISVSKDSNVISISGKAQSPRLAQEIVTALSQSFLDEHLRLSRTRGSHAFFSEQTKLLDDQLMQATYELRDAKNLYGLLSIDGKRSMLEHHIEQVEDQVLKLETDLTYSEKKLHELQTTVHSLSPTVVTQSVSGFGHGATDGMRQQLYGLEIRERELLSKFHGEHPHLVAIRTQRQEVQEILAQQPDQRAQTTIAVNQTHQLLEQQRLAEKTTLASLRAKGISLDQQRERLQEELRTTNDHEIRIVQLQRQVELWESKYRTYSENLEQARIDQALQAERISSINIVQPATYTGQPVSPKKRLTLVLGLALATFGGIALALIAEYLDHSFSTSAEVERQLQVPVLLSIPRTSRYGVVLDN